MALTQNKRIKEFAPLPCPDTLCGEIPIDSALAEQIAGFRHQISSLLKGEDQRILAIFGPCSIHDPIAGLEYAKKFAALAKEVENRFLCVMRVYFEKPRTTVGWKGLINDPHLDGSRDIITGLRQARSFLRQVAELGIPAATEFLDPIVPQYTADLVSWAAIGARTTESQTHREMASGLSMPVGFKNSTDGSLQVAIDAMVSASNPHSFLGIDGSGKTSIVHTQGNPDVHVILRGGNKGPNYDPVTVKNAVDQVNAPAKARPIMIDCSHGNSNKDFTRQPQVFTEVIEQVESGTSSISGVMLESNLVEGKQPLGPDLTYGQSITDGCISWEQTAQLFRKHSG